MLEEVLLSAEVVLLVEVGDWWAVVEEVENSSRVQMRMRRR